MSREIDFTSPLSPSDARYAASRPWLVDRYQRATGETVTYEAEDGSEMASPVPETPEGSSPTGNATPSGESTQDGPEDETYEDWNVAGLKAEIRARNEQMDEDDQIEPASERKVDLIAALEADDATAEDDTDA